MDKTLIIKRFCMGLGVALLAPWLAYFAAVLILGSITTPADRTLAAKDKQMMSIYVRTNGIHTDVIMPLQHEVLDWRKVLPASAFKLDFAPHRYVAMGYGDRGFLQEVPRFSELSLGVALRAGFGFSTGALHADLLADVQESTDVRRVMISAEGYRRLTEHVLASFTRKAATGNGAQLGVENAANVVAPAGAQLGAQLGAVVPIRSPLATENQALFAGEGRYHLLFTCNEWTRQGLAAAGVATPIWAVFPGAVMRAL